MLLGSSTLDVVIGLIFVYLAVSLICSALNEVIEMRLKNRSKDLERGVRELLTNTMTKADPANPKPFDIVQKLYDHPLLSGLFQEDYATAKLKGNLPSYIPAHNFALALMDLVGCHGETAAVASGTANATANSLTASANPLTALRGAAVAFADHNEKVSRAMIALIDAAGNDAHRARRNIENWFDSSMDRVSGWYKRRTQMMVFAIGMSLAAVANIDTVGIVRTLSTDAGVRDALVSQAKEYAAHNPAPISTQSPTVADLRQLGLPIGWEASRVPGDVYAWLIKILGIIMTGLAVSLGAPFWFDLLNKFIVVRSTVKPEEKSQPEKSKE